MLGPLEGVSGRICNRPKGDAGGGGASGTVPVVGQHLRGGLLGSLCTCLGYLSGPPIAAIGPPGAQLEALPGGEDGRKGPQGAVDRPGYCLRGRQRGGRALKINAGGSPEGVAGGGLPRKSIGAGGLGAVELGAGGLRRVDLGDRGGVLLGDRGNVRNRGAGQVEGARGGGIVAGYLEGPLGGRRRRLLALVVDGGRRAGLGNPRVDVPPAGRHGGQDAPSSTPLGRGYPGGRQAPGEAADGTRTPAKNPPRKGWLAIAATEPARPGVFMASGHRVASGRESAR